MSSLSLHRRDSCAASSPPTLGSVDRRSARGASTVAFARPRATLRIATNRSIRQPKVVCRLRPHPSLATERAHSVSRRRRSWGRVALAVPSAESAVQDSNTERRDAESREVVAYEPDEAGLPMGVHSVRYARRVFVCVCDSADTVRRDVLTRARRFHADATHGSSLRSGGRLRRGNIRTMRLQVCPGRESG